MPKRKRKGKKRKGSSATRIMKQRLGLVGWKGSKPYHAFSKTLITKTLGEGHNPGTTTGATIVFPVNNWNDPLGTLSTLVAGTGSLTSNRHPMNHDDAMLDNYEVVQVLSWKLDLTINWIKADDPVSDFMVGYLFVANKASEIALDPAAGAARIERLEMLTNPRWTVKHYRAVQGITEVRPRSETLSISVPNVFQYLKIIAAGSDATVSLTNAHVSHVIADVNDVTNSPLVSMACTIAIMTESGLAMAIDSLHVTARVTQKVKIMRGFFGSEDMDEGEADTHA